MHSSTCHDVQDLSQESIQTAAEELAEEAYKNSLDFDYLSPFAKEGSCALSWEYSGGKPDDITILLAAVVQEWPVPCYYN